MNDKERTIESPSYHMIFGIRRKKENRELKEIVFRQIVRDIDTDLRILKARIAGNPGTWRIYHTVNARLHAPARKLLMKRLIDYPEDSYRIDTLYKTMLLKPECKATRHFLIDVDTKDKSVLTKVGTMISSNDIGFFKNVETPNGYHWVTEKFDTRMIEEFPDVSLQRDGYYLLDVIKEE